MEFDPDVELDLDVALARLGAELADRVVAAVPGWVTRCVEGALPVTHPERDAVLARAEVAATRAQQVVADALGALVGADVDAQRTTPLAVVRSVVSYPTEVLRRAAVPPVPRDRFASERFPEDLYGLTPATLQALDPGLGDVALAWGAAKAMAHRRRHGGPAEFT
jgi:hypothetical protein